MGFENNIERICHVSEYLLKNEIYMSQNNVILLKIKNKKKKTIHLLYNGLFYILFNLKLLCRFNF